MGDPRIIGTGQTFCKCFEASGTLEHKNACGSFVECATFLHSCPNRGFILVLGGDKASYNPCLIIRGLQRHSEGFCTVSVWVHLVCIAYGSYI